MSSTATVTAADKPLSYDINIPYASISQEEQTRIEAGTPYPKYLPTFDKVWFDPLPSFTFEDPALRADPSKPHLLTADVKQTEITPRMGTILDGIDLSKLDNAGKDELALLISERKIVVLPAQDAFLDIGPGAQQQFMNYFGKPNYQPVSGSLKGHPGFHIIHRDGNKDELDRFFMQKTTSCLWHQDVSYERQPPGYVMLGLLQGPKVGGDTVFAATDEAYKYVSSFHPRSFTTFSPCMDTRLTHMSFLSRRLSPTFRSMLDKVKAIHSSNKMIAHTRAVGGLVRKDPVTSVHPLVRVHPVTKSECLFINNEFITGFQGMKDAEFRVLSDFLWQHIVTGHDFQARVHWQPKTVVIFDNRSTLRE